MNSKDIGRCNSFGLNAASCLPVSGRVACHGVHANGLRRASLCSTYLGGTDRIALVGGCHFSGNLG